MNTKARSWIRTTLRATGATATAVVLVLLGTAPALAQVSTGVIEVVTQPPLPGVAVQVVNTATGLQRVAVTNAQGLARILALPPGTYDVSLQVEGYSPPSYDGVVLRVGQTVRLSFSETPEISDTITVVSTVPVFDVYKTDSSTNIVPEQIEQLPVADRDFQRLAFIAPGVQRERGAFRFISGGPVIGAGGNASQSTILVDGVDFTDQALGLARTRFSQDAIREFRVIANRFDAEVGGSAGGALSIVTRSGGNDLAGTLFAFYRADSLRAKGELEQDKVDFNRYQLGFTLGGPIAADKTHFFSSLEYIDEENITLFRPGGGFAGLADDVEHPFDQLLGLVGVDHQFSPGTTGSAKLVYERYRESNFRVGGVADVSNGQELNRDNWNLAFGHTRVFSDREWLNEARLQFGHREYAEPTNSHAVEEWFSSGITLKTGNNLLGDLLGEGDYWELRDTFRWSAGSHDFKAGLGVYHVEERSVIDTFQEGLFIYLFDDRSYPLLYLYGVGSSDVEVKTDIYSVFIQDDWRPSEHVTVSLGLRYDYDTDGNNPDFTHPL
ncbi:MAG: TonB-dependent receptor, partial [bacterium]|nr:TonB-dependent receptor [bacterium]